MCRKNTCNFASIFHASRHTLLSTQLDRGRMRTLLAHSSFICLIFFTGLSRAQDMKVLFDFEDSHELKSWEFKKNSASLVRLHAAHGNSSLKINSNEYMSTFKAQNWSGF